jgi:hypothetical protein
MEETVYGSFKGEIALWAGLEMHMIRNRSSARGTVIIKNIVREGFRHIEHIHIAVPYRLVDMVSRTYYKMAWENRKTVDYNLIFAPLPALEGKKMLLLRTILAAEAAWTRLQ